MKKEVIKCLIVTTKRILMYNISIAIAIAWNASVKILDGKNNMVLQSVCAKLLANRHRTIA